MGVGPVSSAVHSTALGGVEQEPGMRGWAPVSSAVHSTALGGAELQSSVSHHGPHLMLPWLNLLYFIHNFPHVRELNELCCCCCC